MPDWRKLAVVGAKQGSKCRGAFQGPLFVDERLGRRPGVHKGEKRGKLGIERV